VIAILGHLGGIPELYEGGSGLQQVTMIHHGAGRGQEEGEEVNGKRKILLVRYELERYDLQTVIVVTHIIVNE